jgi:hypothetical protein
MRISDLTTITGFVGEAMRLSWTLIATVLFAGLTVAGQSLALETGGHHLRTLAARQELRAMVCYAMADGSINPVERQTILLEAKEILSQEEFLKFQKTLDRISPPPKPPASHLAMLQRKKLAKSKSLPKGPVESQPGPVIPAGAALPDRVAPPVFFR